MSKGSDSTSRRRLFKAAAAISFAGAPVAKIRGCAEDDLVLAVALPMWRLSTRRGTKAQRCARARRVSSLRERGGHR
jgi:hypothetical protein